MMATGGDCGASKALVQRLLYPGSPWPQKYPELRVVSTDHPCNASRDVIANNRWSLAPGYPEEAWSFFSSDPKVAWDDDTPANLRAWTTVVANNTALKSDDDKHICIVAAGGGARRRLGFEEGRALDSVVEPAGCELGQWATRPGVCVDCAEGSFDHDRFGGTPCQPCRTGYHSAARWERQVGPTSAFS